MAEENEILEAPKPERKAASRLRAKSARKPAPKKAMKAMLSSPEGQKLIDQAVEAKFASMLAQFEDRRGTHGTGPVEGADLSLIRQLAVAIGEVSDQGAKIKRVAPAEMEARVTARKAMEDLIIDTAAKGEEIPQYDLTREVYLDEQLVPATYIDRDHRRCVQSVEWPGVPDESMRPVNASAKAIYAHFIRSIGARTQEAKVPYKRATQAPGLRVMNAPDMRQSPPEVGNQRGDGGGRGGLTVLRSTAPGEVKTLQVLGTRAEPARQVG